ncbi:oligosaccharide flippase family protein [Actinomyces sp. B33]|uniref:lipopolysaccharide biosynthesis protein n=1 Tax=Actinomyces sp. B33 TaxID=2942131 RepID=UPI002342724E|nr:oligosaccharide flippase family protein [Actinomyces sp. B33]MDC4232635.1 oligosaccharide flippase family protein [Actinomyces sp. B33]
MKLPGRLLDAGRRHPTLVHVSTLLTGTVLAQLVVLVTTPIIARLYSPSQIGAFAALMAIPQVIAPVAALRYDMAIVLPDSEAEARRLMRAVLACSGAVSVLVCLVCAVWRDPIASLLGHPEASDWLWWSGPLVFCTATTTALGYWMTRRTRFAPIGRNRVVQAGLVESTRIGMALAGAGAVPGQVLSQVVGQAGASALLAWTGREAFSPPGTDGRPLRRLFARYRRMPLLNAPNALVDAVRVNGIVVLIGVYFAADPQGQFSRAWLLMQAPVALVTGALSQVFYQRFARVERGSMTRLVIRSARASLLAGLVPFAVLWLVAPVLLPWYLGPGWEESGLIARALVPWLLLNVVTSPISTVFVVADRQALMLGFAVVYAAVPLALISWFGSSGTSIVVAVHWVSAAMALLLAGLVALTGAVARAWDRAPAGERGPA